MMVARLSAFTGTNVVSATITDNCAATFYGAAGLVIIVRVLRGQICNADVLRLVSLRAPDRYVWRRHRPSLLAVPNGCTKLLKEAPLTRALRTLNSREDGFILLRSE
ncbi:jg785 [Pararge aegeria aegeria]|uniref:Jg785 protein n=1 Tax=Pararge aegeria aegeria TaxID=348720 RepID=A0A8S4S8E0_9NEOP|nr:jg785 [Pararge aegeria aegeria]